MAELIVFDEAEFHGACPKCKHKPQSGAEEPHIVQFIYDSGEWLQIECRRCGYAWRMATADQGTIEVKGTGKPETVVRDQK